MKLHDPTLIDSVFGYCAFAGVEVSSLAPLTFMEVSKLLAETAQHHPEYILASYEVRKYYEICHGDCHISRIRALLANGGWEEGQGPNAEVNIPDNVVEFPTNNTKH